MKRSEWNLHHKKADYIVNKVMCDVIGGYENTLEDFEEDDEEYIEAKAYLSRPKEELVEKMYQLVMSESDHDIDKHLRFAGSDFIRERIRHKLTEWGY